MLLRKNKKGRGIRVATSFRCITKKSVREMNALFFVACAIRRGGGTRDRLLLHGGGNLHRNLSIHLSDKRKLPP